MYADCNLPVADQMVFMNTNLYVLSLFDFHITIDTIIIIVSLSARV